MTNDEKKEEIAEDTSHHIQIQYSNQKNQKLLKEIARFLLEDDVLDWDHFYDLDYATGWHLTLIAKALLNIDREFAGIALTDDELRFVCKLKILSNRIDCFDISQIKEGFRTVFQQANIRISLEPHKLYVAITESNYNEKILKSCIKYNLFPIPICTTLYLSFVPQKTIFFPACQQGGHYFYGELYSPPSRADDELPYAKFADIDKVNIIIRNN